MTAFLPILFAAALTVAPSDRFALADRLFNRGEYALARTEYEALRGEKAIAADELDYRLAECARSLGDADDARTRFSKFITDYPLSRHADRVRLRLALFESGDERVRQLRLLDSDRVVPELRAEALYHLGEASGSADCFARSAKCDPRGRYHAPALIRQAAILSRSESDDDRRHAVALFLEVAFAVGIDPQLAESSLHMAATTSFASRQYGEAGSLARRYLKVHPNGAHAQDCLEMSVWCDYLNGKCSDAVVRAGDGKTDDLAYVRAAATLALGDEPKARELLDAYLVIWPQGRYRAKCELALARLDRTQAEKGGDVAKAVESARRALALSGTASDRMRLAWAYERADRTDEAIAEYRKVAELHPDTAEAALAMYLKAMIDLRAERWSEADLALAEALAGRLDSSYRGEATYWRGMAALRLGHPDEGAKALRSAIDSRLSLDHCREARLAIADIDFNAGRTNEAVAAYTQLVRDGAVVRMSAAKTYAIGRLLPPEEKKLCAESLVRSESPEWRQIGYALLAEAEESLGHLAAVQSAWEKCVAEPCETEPLAMVAVKLGWLRSKCGDHAGAEAILKRAVELNQNDNDARADAYLALAVNASNSGDREAAKGYATVVVTLFENTPSANGAIGLLKTLEAK